MIAVYRCCLWRKGLSYDSSVLMLPVEKGTVYDSSVQIVEKGTVV